MNIENKSDWRESIAKEFGTDNITSYKLIDSLTIIENNKINTEYLLKPQEFCDKINEFLKLLVLNIKNDDEKRKIGIGDILTLHSDGQLRYNDILIDSEEKKHAYSYLEQKNYNNVIEALDIIDKRRNERENNEALAQCRIALEAFYKRLLIKHGINTLQNGKKVEDGMVSELAQAIKNNLNIFFNFPSYSHNLDTEGIPHLIESSKHMISGLANPAGSHGKSDKPEVTHEEIKVAVSFLLLLINTLIPLEK